MTRWQISGLQSKEVPHAILVLHHDNRITATVMVGFDGHRGWLYYLAVDPECRNSGLGRLMMEAAENGSGSMVRRKSS